MKRVFAILPLAIFLFVLPSCGFLNWNSEKVYPPQERTNKKLSGKKFKMSANQTQNSPTEEEDETDKVLNEIFKKEVDKDFPLF